MVHRTMVIPFYDEFASAIVKQNTHSDTPVTHSSTVTPLQFHAPSFTTHDPHQPNLPYHPFRVVSFAPRRIPIMLQIA
jgi:hypothetical protein